MTKIETGVTPMVGVEQMVGYLSFWMLLILAWKPIYYLIMYFVGVATKKEATSTTYGTYLHNWIVSLWNLVL